MQSMKVTEISHLSAHQSVPVVTCSGHVPTTGVPKPPAEPKR